LKQVASANDIGYSSLDGIYEKDGEYYITFCHGDMMGNIKLQIGDVYISVESLKNLRDIIYSYTGFHIKKSEKITIFPCHSKNVAKKYADELIEENVNILFRSISNTRLVFFNLINDKIVQPYKGNVSNMAISTRNVNTIDLINAINAVKRKGQN
jgi:ribosomal protein L28